MSRCDSCGEEAGAWSFDMNGLPYAVCKDCWDSDRIRSRAMGTLAALAIVLLALALVGCGSAGNLRIGGERRVAPDVEVVRALVCRGELAEAQLYVERRGGSPADATEMLERAKAKCPKPEGGPK